MICSAIFKPWFSAASIAVLLLTASAALHADTYQIYNLGSDSRFVSIIGITASGAVVLETHPGICSEYGDCYDTYVNGQLVSTSTTAPDLTYDNGAPCTPTINAPGPFYIEGAACNGGREVWGTASDAKSPPGGMFPESIFDGPDPSTDFVTNGLLDGPLLNAAGDFVYTQLLPGQNPFDDVQYFQAVLVPAPEPASILLLDTGVIALIGAAIRRRMRSAVAEETQERCIA
jgi:hypothetical protein